MLGMRIQRDRKARTITLDQEQYVTKALEKFGLSQCKVVSTPEAVGAVDDRDPALEQPTERQRYMEIVGTLMYAAISTRPDIAHAVHYLASNMQAPTHRHALAAERVLRYLAGTVRDSTLVSLDGVRIERTNAIGCERLSESTHEQRGERGERVRARTKGKTSTAQAWHAQ